MAHLEALRRFDLDTVMFPVYPALWSRPEYREPAEELLAVCAERDVGVMVDQGGGAAALGRPASAGRGRRRERRHGGPLGRLVVRAAGQRRGDRPGHPLRPLDARRPRLLHARATSRSCPACSASAERYAPMGDDERRAAVEAMAAEELIFPMPR